MLENVCWGHVHVVVTTWCCQMVSNVPSPMEMSVRKYQEAWGIETPPGICLRPSTAREASVQSSGAMMRGTLTTLRWAVMCITTLKRAMLENVCGRHVWRTGAGACKGSLPSTVRLPVPSGAKAVDM